MSHIRFRYIYYYMVYGDVFNPHVPAPSGRNTPVAKYATVSYVLSNIYTGDCENESLYLLATIKYHSITRG